ncbi:MAG: class III extradiol ring-cleavage dioxygenase [Pseudomonadota bacterium]
MDVLPSLFVSHGSPMIALQPGAAGAFLARLGPALDAAFGRPRAIVAVSAHTLARAPLVLGAARHEAVHDFGGFPAELYRLRYDAPGSPDVAGRVMQLLGAAGIGARHRDAGGLDHGIWTVLRHLYPDADVPVVPLAFAPSAPPAQQFALGAALAPLRSEGVLVLGTGSITHNLRRLFGGVHGTAEADAPEIGESAAFRRWFAERSMARDWPALFDYRAQAPHAVDMHPTDEHLLPWFAAAGAGGADAAPRRLHASVTLGALGMDAYAFGPDADRLGQALQR